jgi:hypothetical protein
MEVEYTNWMKCLKCDKIFILPEDVAIEIVACIIAKENGFDLRIPDYSKYHKCKAVR